MDDGKKSATNYKPVIEILKKFKKKNFTKFTSDLRTGKEPRVPIKYSLGNPLLESVEFKGVENRQPVREIKKKNLLPFCIFPFFLWGTPLDTTPILCAISIPSQMRVGALI